MPRLLDRKARDARGAALLGAGSRECVRVKLQQIVRGGDQPPLRARRDSAAALEAVDATVELCVGEGRLNHCAAPSVELAAMIGRQDSAHEGVEAAVPARAGAFVSVL